MWTSLHRSFSTSSHGIQRIGMIGMGLMGHGIAQAAATAGYQVVAVDVQPDALKAGMNMLETSVRHSLTKQVSKGKLDENEVEDAFSSIVSRIVPSTTLDSLAEVDLVIEAIVEDVKVKQPLYAQLGEIVAPHTILASNTSSLPVQVMSDVCGRPDKMIGLHFFNPVQIMQLVEVIRTNETDPEVFARCKSWVESIGKMPVSCKDTPGFIVNRLLVPSLAQALLMLERGDATKEDIDLSMQLGAGHPMGPITLADYVGLDTCLSILEGWVDQHPQEAAFVVPTILREKVQQGHFGRKTGQGFYQWKGNKRLD